VKIDTFYVFRDMDDKEIKINGKVQTFAIISCQALLGVAENTNPSGDDKVMRYNLALRLHNNDITDLNLDELKLLKDLIGQAFTPLIVGQAWELLEPKGGDDG